MANVKKDEFTFALRFGGGQHSSKTADEIDPRECVSGENYDLDIENTAFKGRAPFDRIGTVPNAAEIRGGITLKQIDGTTTTLFQAGDTVYEWDGATTFTSRGTVSSSAQLRGRIEHNWALGDKVLVTDLNLQQAVSQWNGTAFSAMTENLAGSFLAKYCFVANERAYFGNVVSNSVATPHMIVGSERGDNETLSVTDRPSSALSEADPFFILTPDLKPINGLVGAFGTTVLSSRFGSIFKITGSTAKDFAVEQLYADSSASGDESLLYTGNDIVYGRDGVIESISATDKFGDVENNDLSRWISDAVRTFSTWTNVYNRRTKRAFFFPAQSQVWAYNQAVLEKNISPWFKWTTAHTSAFNPTFVMNMFDPADGLEYIFFGDASGNIYRLEGTGAAGDAGSEDIHAYRTSGLLSFPENMISNSVEGYLKYRKQSTVSEVTITHLNQGETSYDVNKTVDIPRASANAFYSGGSYFDGGAYYGTSGLDRVYRQNVAPEGSSKDMQVNISVEGVNTFEILEYGLRGKLST